MPLGKLWVVTPDLVHIGANETAIVLLDVEPTAVNLHFCEELSKLIRCNGLGCFACQAGQGILPHLLIPVYRPASEDLGTLSVKDSRRPGELWPQLMRIRAREEQPPVILVSKQNGRLSVETRSWDGDDANYTAKKIWYEKQRRAGKVDLRGVHPLIDNSRLASNPKLARMAIVRKGRPV